MADLGIIFLRRRYPIHWYQSSYIFITGSMPFRYFWATLYISILSWSEFLCCCSFRDRLTIYQLNISSMGYTLAKQTGIFKSDSICYNQTCVIIQILDLSIFIRSVISSVLAFCPSVTQNILYYKINWKIFTTMKTIKSY